MAETADVITQMDHLPDVRYSVLAPNLKGLENLSGTLANSSSAASSIKEVAVLTAASEAFSHANTGCSIAESLERARQITEAALDRGFRVRGYIGVTISCPYSGKADYSKVRDIAKELIAMGCYEVSLADTTGTGNPHSVAEMIQTVISAVPANKLAVSVNYIHLLNLLILLAIGTRKFTVGQL
jgi:hydroxymethylglutaryl-CoA lyase